jgi:hypothetical protein
MAVPTEFTCEIVAPEKASTCKDASLFLVDYTARDSTVQREQHIVYQVSDDNDSPLELEIDALAVKSDKLEAGLDCPTVTYARWYRSEWIWDEEGNAMKS